MTSKRAAHFLNSPDLADSPLNHALISALLELGYRIDVFTSDAALDLSHYGPRVTAQHAEFGYRWLATHLMDPRWLSCTIFSGTTEDPVAAAGLLARVYRGRCMTVADEVKSALGPHGGTIPLSAPDFINA